ALCVVSVVNQIRIYWWCSPPRTGRPRTDAPTGPFFARFFIGIIPGLVAEFAFMVPSTRVGLSSSAARLMGRKQIGGLKSRLGCSTGRHTLTPGFWQLNR